MLRALVPLLVFCLGSAPLPARACGQPVCLIAVSDLDLAHVITFDDIPSSMATGTRIDDVLVRPGASFGERFAGQSLESDGDFDAVSGAALGPLVVMGGGAGRTLGALRLWDTTVLQGHGHRGFPADNAVGEGAIAVLFDHDQAAFAVDIRGGEQGFATLVFLARDGAELHRMRLGPLAEQSYGFMRAGWHADIAGIVLFNTDPQGLAIDNLRFDAARLLG